MQRIKWICIVSTSLTTILFVASTQASLELLAGVEAGIETNTAMTSTDLARTQNILSNLSVGSRQAWQNPNTGTYYEIKINHHYSFNHNPCVAYRLLIQRKANIETKALNSCKNTSGHWISINHGSTAL